MSYLEGLCAIMIAGCALCTIFGWRRLARAFVEWRIRARTQKRAHARAYLREHCPSLIDFARARYAVAQISDDNSVDFTDLYNCLVDQEMLSSAQLASMVPGITRAYVGFDGRFREFVAIISVIEKKVIIFAPSFVGSEGDRQSLGEQHF